MFSKDSNTKTKKTKTSPLRGLGLNCLPSSPGPHGSDLDFLLPRFHPSASSSKTPSPSSSPVETPMSGTASHTPTGLRTPEEELVDCFWTPTSRPWTSPRPDGRSHARGYSSAAEPSRGIHNAQSANIKQRRALQVPLHIATPGAVSPGGPSVWHTPQASPRSPRFSNSIPTPRNKPKSKLVWVGLALLAFVLLLDATIAATSSQPSLAVQAVSLITTTFSSPFASLLRTSRPTGQPSNTEEPHRDTVVLYRIIGNDLPPRHALNQTLQNVQFLLENELDVSDVSALPSPASSSSSSIPSAIQHIDKYFVLNRITLPDTRTALKRLLLDFNVPEDRILEIPFEWEEYEQRQFRWDGGVADAADVWGFGGSAPQKESDAQTRLEKMEVTNSTLSAVAEEASPLSDPALQINKKRRRAEVIGKLRALDYTYHDKNLYAMNNNGGRNFALEHGRTLPSARWILPLDGNCFFTPPAFASLIDNLNAAETPTQGQKHVVIPMKRLLDNQVVMSTNSIDAIASEAGSAPPITSEEPQVGFRFDSTESFQELMRYGRRSKLEFLWRLGAVPRDRKLDQRTLPWESSDRSYLTAASHGSIRTRHNDSDDNGSASVGYASAGWVYRLFSGDRNQEITSPSANSLRNMNRIKGIVGYLEGLDEQLSRGRMCSAEFSGGSNRCGFRQRNTVTWDPQQLRKFRAGVRADQPEALERLVQLAQQQEQQQQSSDPAMKQEADPIQQKAQQIATSAALAYLTDDLLLARQLTEEISKVFFPSPRQFLRESQAALDRVTAQTASQSAEGEGYAFPVLPPSRQSGGRLQPWRIFAHPDAALASLDLPFEPTEFDPSALLDGLRLIHELDPGLLPMSTLQTLFSAQLAHLLQPSYVKQTTEFKLDEARAYDLKVVALAAFLDDVRLLNRVKHRAHLRSADRTMDPALVSRLEHAGLIDQEVQDNGLVWQVMDHL